MDSHQQRYEFDNGRGQRLAARLELPAGDVKGWVLYAHCFTCSKDIITARRLSQGLAARGLAVLRFDFTGLGDSEGRFSETTFSSNVLDLVAAAHFLRHQWQAPALFIGHSLGGAAVLAAAAEVPECKAVVTLNAPASPDHLMPVFQPYLAKISAAGKAVVPVVGIEFEISQAFIEDLVTYDLTKKIHHLNRPLLILHAPDDQVVDVDEARKIFQAARHPKSFIALDQADHLLKVRGHAEYAAGLIAAWAAPYLSTGDLVLTGKH